MGGPHGAEAVTGRRAHRAWLRGLLLACVVAVMTGPDPKAALGAVSQLTSPEAGCIYMNPTLSGNGQWLVAASLCRAAENETELVLIERASGQMQVLGPRGSRSGSPTLSSDGRRIAFLSHADFVPGQNPDHQLQIFLFDTGTLRYRQLTHVKQSHTRQALRNPRISGNGETVAFVSDADLVSGQNEDGNMEVFLLDMASGQLHQVTQTQYPAEQYQAFISHDGQTVVFLGVHPPFVKREAKSLFRWSRQTGSIQRLLEPTSDAGAILEPAMASSGERVVFRGRYDFLGENPQRYYVLFTVDVATGMVRQVVHSRGCTSGHPALSADGLRLVFMSNCGFDGLNPMRDPNLFVMRLDNGEVIQLTDTDNFASLIQGVTMDDSGRLVAASIGDELKGMVNPQRSLQVAILDVPAIQPVAQAPMSRVSAQELSGLLVSRHEPDTLYAFGPTIGIMKTTTNGQFWKLASFGLGSERVVSLIEDPLRPGVLMAGTSETGVYKTIDGGQMWGQANTGLADKRILALVVDSLMPEVVYAETPTGLYRSQDASGVWRRVGEPLAPQSADTEHREVSPVSLTGRAPACGGHGLISVPGAIGRLVKCSETGLFVLNLEEGEWLSVDTPDAPLWVVANPKGTVWLIGTNQGVYRAGQLDGEWVRVAELPAEPIPSITIGPTETVYAATRGGIYLSSDGARTWSSMCDLHDVARLMPASFPGLVLISALQDGSLRLSQDGGVQWSPLVIPAPSPQGVQTVLIRPSQ